MSATLERVAEVIKFALTHSEKEACEVYNIKPESLARYKRIYQSEIDAGFVVTKTLKDIHDRYSEKELKAIAEGGRLIPGYGKAPVIDFEGDLVTIGFLTDPHIGSKYYREEFLDAAYEEFDKEKVDFVTIVGDLTEGMSHRPGHIYELSHIGYAEQKEYAIEQISKWDGKIYMIDGNHDRWFLKSNGALIVKDICEQLPNAEFLGHDEGDISLKGKAVLKLWHGEDGNSYAISYRLQKLAEAFTGGEKPNVVFCGHVHKQGYFMIRHIHMISGGALCTQSKWMRRTRKENHSGFHVVKIWINDTGVAKLQPTWYPLYA